MAFSDATVCDVVTIPTSKGNAVRTAMPVLLIGNGPEKVASAAGDGDVTDEADETP